jgi:hypothetical protein
MLYHFQEKNRGRAFFLTKRQDKYLNRFWHLTKVKMNRLNGAGALHKIAKKFYNLTPE